MDQAPAITEQYMGKVAGNQGLIPQRGYGRIIEIVWNFM